ncbi:hypothetical protein [Haloferula sargassicola]|uniref:Uncharacterized protein n=1 Tax=Haloferula sargassicola TaxID=490096 RepID=A0ABP9UKD6_9BACT
MKSFLQSQFRHVLTFVPGLTGFLVALPFMKPEDGAEVNGLLMKIFAALIGLLVLMITRAVMWSVEKWAPGLAPLLKGNLSQEEKQDGANAGSSGGNLSVLFLAAAAGLSMAGLTLLPSCSVAASALTGAPIPAESVQRAGDPDAHPILIVADDLARAEREAEQATENDEPAPVNGLYDAGRAAAMAREVFTDSGK